MSRSGFKKSAIEVVRGSGYVFIPEGEYSSDGFFQLIASQLAASKVNDGQLVTSGKDTQKVPCLIVGGKSYLKGGNEKLEEASRELSYGQQARVIMVDHSNAEKLRKMGGGKPRSERPAVSRTLIGAGKNIVNSGPTYLTPEKPPELSTPPTDFTPTHEENVVMSGRNKSGGAGRFDR